MIIEEAALQELLAAYTLNPNTNTVDGTSPAEQMFNRKITTIFDKMLLTEPRINRISTPIFQKDQLVLFRVYQIGKQKWELGNIVKCIGKIVYVIQGREGLHKRHIKQIQCKLSVAVWDVPITTAGCLTYRGRYKVKSYHICGCRD